MDSHAGEARTRDSYSTPCVLGLHYDDYYCRARRGSRGICVHACGVEIKEQRRFSHLVENGVAKGLGSAGFVGGKTPRWQIGAAAAEIAIYLGRAIRW